MTDSLSQQLFLYQSTLENSKLTKCIRFKVYGVAEMYSAKVRDGFDDGIFYKAADSKNLFIQLVFEEKRAAEQFQSAIRQFQAKRKLDNFSLTVEDRLESIISTSTLLTTRVFQNNYSKLDGETDLSEDCDGDSILSGSNTSVAES